MPKKKSFDVEKHQKQILKDFEKNEFKSVDNLDQEMRIAKEAAKNYTRRENRINIRISSADLAMIRKIAFEEGLPYQTLLASIIHKYVTGRLVDKRGSLTDAK